MHDVALSDAAEETVLPVPSGGPGSEGRITLREPEIANARPLTVQLRSLDECDNSAEIGFHEDRRRGS